MNTVKPWIVSNMACEYSPRQADISNVNEQCLAIRVVCFWNELCSQTKVLLFILIVDM